MNEEKIEKKLTLALIIIAVVAIIAVILIYFPWGGDKAEIRKDYDFLSSNDHVYEYITIEEVETKIANGETFHLYLGNKNLTKVNYFVYYLDQLAKEYNVEEVYYLDYSELSDDNLNYIRQKSTPEIDVSEPTVIYFTPNEPGAESKAFDISCIRNFSGDYESNYWLLLRDYFRNCYTN